MSNILTEHRENEDGHTFIVLPDCALFSGLLSQEQHGIGKRILNGIIV